MFNILYRLLKRTGLHLISSSITKDSASKMPKLLSVIILLHPYFRLSYIVFGRCFFFRFEMLSRQIHASILYQERESRFYWFHKLKSETNTSMYTYKGQSGNWFEKHEKQNL